MGAAKEGHAEVAKLLLANGADVNVKSREGKTALMYAEENDHTEIVALLDEPVGPSGPLEETLSPMPHPSMYTIEEE